MIYDHASSNLDLSEKGTFRQPPDKNIHLLRLYKKGRNDGYLDKVV